MWMRLEYLEYCKVQILGPLSSNFICGTKKATYWKNKNKLVNQFFLLVLNYRSAFLKKKKKSPKNLYRKILPPKLSWNGQFISKVYICFLKIASFLFILSIFHLLHMNFRILRNLHFTSIHSLSRVWLVVIPWTAASQASLSITNSQSSPKLMFIESVMPSNHLILCRPLLLLPSIFPYQDLFKWVSFSHQEAKELEFQLQHQFFQWTLRTDFL